MLRISWTRDRNTRLRTRFLWIRTPDWSAEVTALRYLPRGYDRSWSPADSRVRFVNHDQRSSSFSFFFPLNCEIMSFLNPVSWWSLVRINCLFFLRRYSLLFSYLFSDREFKKKGDSCFNKTRMALRYLSTIRSFVLVSRVCDVSHRLTNEIPRVKRVSIKKRDCRYELRWEACDWCNCW